MKIPFLDLKAQYETIRKEVVESLDRVLSRQSFILGEEVSAFEEEWAEYCGTRHCVGVSSGTAAIKLTLQALSIGPGDRVLTTPFSFFATAEAVRMVGAEPVFLPVMHDSLLLSAQDVADYISRDGDRKSIKAILPVHLYGQMGDMDVFRNISQDYGIPLIEDSAQAHGSEYKGMRSGSIGRAGCFSFYPGKTLGAYGDAGAITTDDMALYERLKELRDHGRSSKYIHRTVGQADRMDEFQAAVLRVKLPYLNAWKLDRQDIVHLYDTTLPEEIQRVTPMDPSRSTSFHLFVMRHKKAKALHKFLKNRGIDTGFHYPVPLHLQPAFSDLNYRSGSFSEAERAAMEVLSLPLYPEMNEDQTAYVVDAVKDFL